MTVLSIALAVVVLLLCALIHQYQIYIRELLTAVELYRERLEHFERERYRENLARHEGKKKT